MRDTFKKVRSGSVYLGAVVWAAGSLLLYPLWAVWHGIAERRKLARARDCERKGRVLAAVSLGDHGAAALGRDCAMRIGRHAGGRLPQSVT